MLVQTPKLDEISISKWFFHKYNLEELKEIDLLIESHIWITAKKVKVYIKEMETSHIKNCINCWEGNGKSFIPENYLGGKSKWLRIFKEELAFRN